MKPWQQALLRLSDSAGRIVRFAKLMEEGKQIPLPILCREAWISLRRSAKLWLLLTCLVTWRKTLRRQ